MNADDLQASLAGWATDACQAERVDVAWLGIDPARLPAGGTGRWSGDPCRAHPVVELTWGTGDDVDFYTLRPELAVWVAADVAAGPAAAGAAIRVTPGLVRVETAGSWPGGAAVAIRAVRAGEPVTLANARPAADLASGAPVSVVVRAGALEIRSAGKLLEPGRVGQPVRVLGTATHAILDGVLVDRDTVEIREP